MLIGRNEELVRLHRVLTDARLHHSGSLVLRGEAGVGKTALLDQAVEAADGFLILRAVGVAAEMDVPFAGLDALLRPILDMLDTIPPAQAQALRGALALESTEPNGLAAYAGALSLLSAGGIVSSMSRIGRSSASSPAKGTSISAATPTARRIRRSIRASTAWSRRAVLPTPASPRRTSDPLWWRHTCINTRWRRTSSSLRPINIGSRRFP